MKLKPKSIFIILVILTGAVLSYAYLTKPKNSTIDIITDCDLTRIDMANGVKWEYVNPADANRPTAECKPVRLYR